MGQPIAYCWLVICNKSTRAILHGLASCILHTHMHTHNQKETHKTSIQRFCSGNLSFTPPKSLHLLSVLWVWPVELHQWTPVPSGLTIGFGHWGECAGCQKEKSDIIASWLPLRGSLRLIASLFQRSQRPSAPLSTAALSRSSNSGSLPYLF